jgi:hypothetical protein
VGRNADMQSLYVLLVCVLRFVIASHLRSGPASNNTLDNNANAASNNSSSSSSTNTTESSNNNNTKPAEQDKEKDGKSEAEVSSNNDAIMNGLGNKESQQGLCVVCLLTTRSMFVCLFAA